MEIRLSHDKGKKLISLFALLSSLLLSLTAFGAEESGHLITVHYPSVRTVNEYGLMAMSVSVPAGTDQIRVYVSYKEEIIRVSDRQYICFTVELELGENIIEIEMMKDDKVIDTVSRTVFRRSELTAKYRDVPAEFKREYFHMKDHPECAGCHALEPTEYDRTPVSPATFDNKKYDIKKIISVTSTCYSCHKAISTSPYVHGPASVWSCLSCHDDTSSPRYSVMKPDTEMCYKCHVEQKKEWLSKKYTHGPVTIGKCTICHSPHAAENPFNLFMPVWDLCTNCHYEKGTGKHIFADSMFQEGHPTKDRMDPLRDGKELTCASCHNPHASNIPHLWIFEVATLYDLCQRCHNK